MIDMILVRFPLGCYRTPMTLGPSYLGLGASVVLI